MTWSHNPRLAAASGRIDVIETLCQLAAATWEYQCEDKQCQTEIYVISLGKGILKQEAMRDLHVVDYCLMIICWAKLSLTRLAFGLNSDSLYFISGR